LTIANIYFERNMINLCKLCASLLNCFQFIGHFITVNLPHYCNTNHYKNAKIQRCESLKGFTPETRPKSPAKLIISLLCHKLKLFQDKLHACTYEYARMVGQLEALEPPTRLKCKINVRKFHVAQYDIKPQHNQIL
jgi:hypothetical protein